MESIVRELGIFSGMERGRKVEAYAHTWVPVSGIMVKRTLSSSRRTQATFPRDEREAVNSG